MTKHKIIGMTFETNTTIQSYLSYVVSSLETEQNELTALDEHIQKRLKERSALDKAFESESTKKLSVGDQMGDKMTAFAGSWPYICLSAVGMASWMTYNHSVTTAFDPYPYILLNLALSCIANIHSPIILMSNKRQEDKDRIRSQHAEEVNRKAELATAQLQVKMDHMIHNHGRRQLELHKIEITLLEKISRHFQDKDDAPLP
jgi:uncharacterized membrane protein